MGKGVRTLSINLIVFVKCFSKSYFDPVKILIVIVKLRMRMIIILLYLLLPFISNENWLTFRLLF